MIKDYRALACAIGIFVAGEAAAVAVYVRTADARSAISQHGAEWYADHSAERIAARKRCVDHQELALTAPCLNSRQGEKIVAYRYAIGQPAR